MAERPKYSFVIPVRNGEETLSATLSSIDQQEYVGSQVIVVDNGSTDSTADIAKSFAHVQYHFHATRGRSSTRNAGARIASGEYLLFVDSDVVLHPHWLKNVDHYLSNTPVDALATQVIPEGDENGMLTSYRTHFARWKTNGSFVSIAQKEGVFPLVNTAACLIKRASFERLGGFDETLKRHEDLDLSIRLFNSGYLIGGTRAAEARVRFLSSRGLSPSLAYLWRAFEVQFDYPWPAERKINKTLLKTFASQGQWGSWAYALTAECASWNGSKAQALFRQRRLIDQKRKPGPVVLTFSFQFQDRFYALDHRVNFVFFDEEVYILKKGFRSFKVSEPVQQALRRLLLSRSLSGNEALNLVETGYFIPRALSVPIR